MSENTIPVSKAVRVGNFKLWRGNYTLKSGKEKQDIDCVHVSSLDGSWMVRIPSTMGLYSTICNGYATTDDTLRENFIGMIATNCYNVTTMGSESLHDAFFFLTEMMSFPYLLLSEKEMKERMEKSMKELGFDKGRRKAHIGEMTEYRRRLYELIEQKKNLFIESYERQQSLQREYERVSEEEDLKRDEIADEAMKIISEDENRP